MATVSYETDDGGGIALRAGDIDAVYCHGYGFPKHLGGPMYSAQQQGLAPIVEVMRGVAARFGPRYQPAPLLERLSASGQNWPA